MKIKLYSLYLIYILDSGLQSVLLLLLPYISKDIDINIAQVGFLATILHVMGVVFAIPAGIWAAKHGGFKILTVAVLLFALGFFITSISWSYLLFFVAFIISGIGYGVCDPIELALSAKIFEPSQRAKGIGELGAIGDLGRVGFTATVGFLVIWFGWRETAIIYGLVASFAFALLFYLFFHKLKETKTSEEEPFEFKYLLKLLKNKLFVTSSASAMIDTFASSQLFVFLPFLFITKHIELTLLASFTAVYFLGNVAGKFLAGRIATKYGSARVFMISELFMAIMIVLMVISSNSIVILILSFILGFSTKWTSPTARAMLVESVPEYETVEIYASSFSFLRVAAKTISPLLLGLIANNFGINNAFYLSAIMAIIAILPAYVFDVNYRKVR